MAAHHRIGDDWRMKDMTPSNRILAWAGIGVAVLLAVATVLNLTGTSDLDPDSPEGVVQLFVNAALDGDEEEALGFLTPELRDACEAELFQPHFSEQTARVALIERRLDGDIAHIEVRVTEGSYDLFDSYDYSHDESFTLTLSAEGWRVTEQTWPWYECSERKLP